MSLLKRFRDESGLTQQQLADAAGTSQPQIRRLENSDRKLTKEWAERLAPALGVKPQELLFAPDRDNEVKVVPIDAVIADDPDFDPDAYEGASSAEPYHPKMVGARPEIDVRPGAGLGTVGQHVSINSKGIATGHRVVAEWLFPDQFIRHEIGATPSGIIVMPVVGDSMRGTLEPGDRILVDTADNIFGQDAIYVIDDGDGEPRVKRLVKILFSTPPKVAIVSDNPNAHREETVELAELRVVGRVVGRVTRM